MNRDDNGMIVEYSWIVTHGKENHRKTHCIMTVTKSYRKLPVYLIVMIMG